MISMRIHTQVDVWWGRSSFAIICALKVIEVNDRIAQSEYGTLTDIMTRSYLGGGGGATPKYITIRLNSIYFRLV